MGATLDADIFDATTASEMTPQHLYVQTTAEGINSLMAPEMLGDADSILRRTEAYIENMLAREKEYAPGEYRQITDHINRIAKEMPNANIAEQLAMRIIRNFLRAQSLMSNRALDDVNYDPTIEKTRLRLARRRKVRAATQTVIQIDPAEEERNRNRLLHSRRATIVFSKPGTSTKAETHQPNTQTQPSIEQAFFGRRGNTERMQRSGAALARHTL